MLLVAKLHVSKHDENISILDAVKILCSIVGLPPAMLM
jgi:hypothetical protein